MARAVRPPKLPEYLMELLTRLEPTLVLVAPHSLLRPWPVRLVTWMLGFRPAKRRAMGSTRPTESEISVFCRPAVTAPQWPARPTMAARSKVPATPPRSEEHTSELQSQSNLVC